MPILSDDLASISETAGTAAQWRERIEDQRIVWKQSDGVTYARSQTVHARAGELELDILSRGNLRRVRFHRSRPGSHGLRGRHIDEHGGDV